MDVVLDQEFRLYRSYQIPTFSEAHRAGLSALVAQYLYIKYSSAATDPTPRYRSAEDIQVVARSVRTTYHGVEVSYLTMKHALATQVVVFLEHGEGYIALIRSSTPLFLVQALESLDMETPLILSPLKLSSAAVRECFNGLDGVCSGTWSILGDVEFTFGPVKPLAENSLKEMIVEIPSKDMKELTTSIGTASKPIERVFDWLANTTTLKFENLEMRGLRCGLVAISVDRLKFGTSIPDEVLAKLLAIITGLATS